MIPVKQRRTDDCFRACIASVLNMDYDAVPDFHDGSKIGQHMSPDRWATMRAWFTARRLCYVELCYEAEVPESFMELYPHLVHLRLGLNRDGRWHGCVYRGGKLIHDPAARLGHAPGPISAGHDGLMRVGLITVLLPDAPLETVSIDPEKQWGAAMYAAHTRARHWCVTCERWGPLVCTLCGSTGTNDAAALSPWKKQRYTKD